MRANIINYSQLAKQNSIFPSASLYSCIHISQIESLMFRICPSKPNERPVNMPPCTPTSLSLPSSLAFQFFQSSTPFFDYSIGIMRVLSAFKEICFQLLNAKPQLSLFPIACIFSASQGFAMAFRSFALF